MGKAGRWLRSFLAGKKDGGKRREKHGGATPVVASPREKKRWSFRRSSAAAATSPATPEPSVSGLASLSERARDVVELDDDEQSKRAMAAAVATASAVLRLAAEHDGVSSAAARAVEVAAAVRIQATYRGYLARKALCALRGLVKLQALIRGNLVRKQATATLRRMQALLLAQARLRAQRMRMLEEDDDDDGHAHRRPSPRHPRHRRSYEMDRSGEEHAKIVEVDVGEPPRRGRSSCSVAASESRERRMAEYGCYGQCSPSPSQAPSWSAAAAFAELAASPPRDAYSGGGHFDEFVAAEAGPFEPATARSSPYVPAAAASGGGGGGGEFFPNYMANTQSSRAKARSQSAPRQRTEPPEPAPAHLERQPSRRRVPRSVKMQRSSSHVGVPAAAAAHGHYHSHYHYPWPVKLDRSSASLKDSECGSTTSSVLTAATTVGYCRSLVGFDLHRSQY